MAKHIEHRQTPKHTKSKPQDDHVLAAIKQPDAVPFAAIHDQRISVAQRQDMVRRMGQVYGNQFVQRVVGQEPMLRTGSSGPAVTTLQEHLVKAGAAITVDGIFGPQTYRAVTAYQKAAGLSVDGIVGPNTWASLKGGGVTITGTSSEGGDAGPQSAEIATKLVQVKTILHQLDTQSVSTPQTQTSQAPASESSQHAHDAWGHDSDEQETGGWFDDWFGDESENDQGQQSDGGDGGSWFDDWFGDENENDQGQQSDGGDGGSWFDDWFGDKDENDQDQQSDGGGGGSWWDSITDWVSDMMQSILKAIAGLTSEISKVVDNLSDRVSKLFAGPLKILRDLIRSGFGPDAAEKLDEIIDKLTGTPEGAEERPVSGSIEDIAGGSLNLATGCGDTAAPQSPQHKPLHLKLNIMPVSSIQSGGVQDSNWGQDRIDASGIWVRTNIQQGGTVAKGWGGAVPTFDMGYITWTLGDDVVEINACLVVDTRWNIRSLGCKDVTGAYSPVVARDTWLRICQELDPSGPNGEPSRSDYWSSQITTVHELYHAEEYYQWAKKVLPAWVNALNMETISVPWAWVTEDDKANIDTIVRAKLYELTIHVREAVHDHYMDGGEARAYQDGAPLYNKLVGEIEDRVQQEHWYPAPSEEGEENKEKEKD